MERYLGDQIRQDLKRKMVFLAGPRQVGKTTLARQIFPSAAAYLNWDIDEHREKILKRQWPPAGGIVLDEIHKYRRWRGLVKGLFDLWGNSRPILVTGSARLDLYRHGGDSLQGRYHLLRMHPFSAAELALKSASDLENLLRLGGFPEPFLLGSEQESRRFAREYRSRLIREDLTSLENVRDLGTLELLALRLPELVGSPLSINALREDLQVSHRSVSSWIHIFEKLYYIFRLPPFGAPSLRAVKKEQKHYQLDWSLIDDPGARFENLVACHLLKHVHFLEDTRGEDTELRFFRDVDGREVDFIVTRKRKPILAIECKASDRDVSGSLRYFKERFPDAEAWQISADGKKDYLTDSGIRVAPALTFLLTLI